MWALGFNDASPSGSDFTFTMHERWGFTRTTSCNIHTVITYAWTYAYAHVVRVLTVITPTELNFFTGLGPLTTSGLATTTDGGTTAPSTTGQGQDRSYTSPDGKLSFTWDIVEDGTPPLTIDTYTHTYI
jgi:hypothetical protein